ncbi:hypothetical protein BEWA_034130 [Theileria equi strain WA]|uniref:Uncharacterized protein n=1 Tax=Theileria equi strain WA TaxID=1537102 RepID=L0AZX7_THEEQ|nr:hypothetical protein BEWA_034130 [Theileria equi strain WA]
MREITLLNVLKDGRYVKMALAG